MASAQENYPTEMTEEEAAVGFQVVESTSGVRAVVLRVGGGLQAIKMRRPDGTIEYAVCDEACHPLYSGARTVAELKRRFGAK